jgi:hypothetical protein
MPHTALTVAHTGILFVLAGNCAIFALLGAEIATGIKATIVIIINDISMQNVLTIKTSLSDFIWRILKSGGIIKQTTKKYSCLRL